MTERRHNLNSLLGYYIAKIYELYDIYAIRLENETYKNMHSLVSAKNTNIERFISNRCAALSMVFSSLYFVCDVDNKNEINEICSAFIEKAKYDIEYENGISKKEKITELGSDYVSEYAKQLYSCKLKFLEFKGLLKTDQCNEEDDQLAFSQSSKDYCTQLDLLEDSLLAVAKADKLDDGSTISAKIVYTVTKYLEVISCVKTAITE